MSIKSRMRGCLAWSTLAAAAIVEMPIAQTFAQDSKPSKSAAEDWRETYAYALGTLVYSAEDVRNVHQFRRNERLSGANRYIMRFPAGELPKVKAFWSVMMYGLNNNLVVNPIDRYKRGSYRKGELKPDADGSLTPYIQDDRRAKTKRATDCRLRNRSSI